jgi:hypothetical protein
MRNVLEAVRLQPELSIYEAARRCDVKRNTVWSWQNRNTRGFKDLLEAARDGGGFTSEDLPNIEIACKSEEWLNLGDDIWPGVMQELKEINSGDYDQILLTGGISSGKTFTAAVSLVYQLLKLLVMDNPHETFGLSDRSPILLAVQNRTQKLATHNDFAVVRSIIENAPVFQNRFPHDQRTKSRIKFIGKNIEVWPVGGDPNNVLGMNLHSLILDEVNFFQNTERSARSIDGNPFDQAHESYETALARKQTRFPGGAGMFFLASSKRYAGQFTDRIEREHKDDPKTYVYNHTAWSIRPDAYPKKRFYVFVGDQSRPPRILQEDEQVALNDRKLVVDVPDTANLRRRFGGNISRALQDIAGIATEQIAGFFRDRVKLNEAASLGNLFKQPDVDLSTTPISDLLYKQYQAGDPNTHFWAHCDLSLSGDKTGIALGKIDDYVLAGDLWVPVIKVPFILRVHPPREGQIELDSIRRLLFELSDRGVPIKWVSFDGFQSADLMQRCAKRYFVHKISTDLTTHENPIAAMECLRSAVSEQRIQFAWNQRVIQELLSLKHDQKKNRVDHPPNGSKDMADALTGVCYGLSKFVRPVDIGRYDIWQKNVQPSEIRNIQSQVTGYGGYYSDSYFSSNA